MVRRSGEAAGALRRIVDASDAVSIATPVHNASIPGGLKAFLDLLPESGLTDKLVLPLASGGSAGHQLAIEYSLKPVLSGTHDVEEAVVLADRVVLIEDGALALDLRIPLSRPRRRGDPAFAAIEGVVLERVLRIRNR